MIDKTIFTSHVFKDKYVTVATSVGNESGKLLRIEYGCIVLEEKGKNKYIVIDSIISFQETTPPMTDEDRVLSLLPERR